MTYLCYIDEAGCTTPLPGTQTDIQPVLVIVGLIVDVARVRELTIDFLKLKRRHPHVFGSRRFKTAAEVLRHWDEIKRGERAARLEDLKKRGR